MKINPQFRQQPASPINVMATWLEQRPDVVVGPFLDVSLSSPKYPPAPELRQFVASSALLDHTSSYTDVEGLPLLREAVATKTAQRYESSVDIREVVITSGCSQAFSAVTTCITEPGDEVLLPSPFYFGHDALLRTIGVTPIHFSLDSALRAADDLDHRLRRYLSERTRALVLVTPGNPTGVTYDPEFIDRCFAFCQRNGLILIIDETYRDLRANPAAPPHRLFKHADWRDVVVQLCSYSKSFSLNGYRVGSIVCSRELVEQIVKQLEATTICPAHLSQLAAWYGLVHLDDWCRERANEVSILEQAFAQLLRQSASGFEAASIGAGFAYLRHPFPGIGAASVARAFLNHQNVLTVPGVFFGGDQEAFLRVSLLNLGAQQLPELVRRMEQFTQQFSTAEAA